MYYPSSIPEKFNPPPPSGVALGGLPPEKQWLRKIEIIKVETPNSIFIVMHYPSSIPENFQPLPPSGVALAFPPKSHP